MNTARSVSWEHPGSEQGELSGVEAANLRLLTEARLVLAAVAASMALFEASLPGRIIVFVILVAYGALAVRDLKRVRAGLNGETVLLNHWGDLACYLPVALLTGALSSPYNVFLLLPVFTACLSGRPRLGVVVALGSCGLLAGVETVSAQLPIVAALRDLPLAQLALGLVFAVVIARWAHTEVTLVRRLAFWNDVSQVFTPQGDLRPALTAFCDMLRAYQRAATCVVLLKDARSAGWLMFEVDGAGKPVRGEPMDEAMVQPLLVVPPDRCVLYRAHPFLGNRSVCTAYDATTLRPLAGVDCAPVAELAQLLEAGSLVSLPLKSRSQVIGRLHLTTRGLSYGRDDLEFLAQVAAQVGVLIENMQLVDRLAQEVANEERKKISRDLHDGTIQPYIGLKLALEALQRKVVNDAVLQHEVEDLIGMAGDGISQLRHYVGNLKNKTACHRAGSLAPAIRRQAEKFSEYYGIAIEVVADSDVAVRGQLFDEVMHLVREALSNIRRHTRSSSVRIELHAAEGRLRLGFVNDVPSRAQTVPEPFFPRSLSERAGELGGRVDVDLTRPGCTVVSVELPL